MDVEVNLCPLLVMISSGTLYAEKVLNKYW